MIGTITLIHAAGAMPSAPSFLDRISFLGDAAYPTGGTAGFKALFRAKAGDNRTPLAVIVEDCGGYTATYDVTNDKLKVWYGNTDAADGPNIEVPNATDLSGVTFKLAVLST